MNILFVVTVTLVAVIGITALCLCTMPETAKAIDERIAQKLRKGQKHEVDRC